MISFVFAHDAPPGEVMDCVDSFLMTEVVSILTEPRGERTDYHMLRTQWNDLFMTVLGPEFSLQGDSACYADEYMALFTMHLWAGGINQIEHPAAHAGCHITAGVVIGDIKPFLCIFFDQGWDLVPGCEGVEMDHSPRHCEG